MNRSGELHPQPTPSKKKVLKTTSYTPQKWKQEPKEKSGQLKGSREWKAGQVLGISGRLG
jgi:hypothetical protein